MASQETVQLNVRITREQLEWLDRHGPGLLEASEMQAVYSGAIGIRSLVIRKMIFEKM